MGVVGTDPTLTLWQRSKLDGCPACDAGDIDAQNDDSDDELGGSRRRTKKMTVVHAI